VKLKGANSPWDYISRVEQPRICSCSKANVRLKPTSGRVVGARHALASRYGLRIRTQGHPRRHKVLCRAKYTLFGTYTVNKGLTVNMGSFRASGAIPGQNRAKIAAEEAPPSILTYPLIVVPAGRSAKGPFATTIKAPDSAIDAIHLAMCAKFAQFPLV
jgi:hypothetical protein